MTESRRQEMKEVLVVEDVKEGLTEVLVVDHTEVTMVGTEEGMEAPVEEEVAEKV